MARDFARMFAERSKEHGLVIEISLNREKVGGQSPIVFLHNIIDATHWHAAAYVLNPLSFLTYEWDGKNLLRDAYRRITSADPNVPVILGDVGRLTADAANFAFKTCEADALIVLLHLENGDTDIRKQHPKKGCLTYTATLRYEHLHLIENLEDETAPVIVGGKMTEGEPESLLKIAKLERPKKKLLLKVGDEIVYAKQPSRVSEIAAYYDKFVLDERAKKVA